jgi:dihydroorotate dehydrogenase (fumarate)
MAGAHVVQLVSTLLRHGPTRLTELRKQFEAWAEAHQYESLEEFQGVAGLAGRGDVARFERGAYLSVLQSWKAEQLPLAD